MRILFAGVVLFCAMAASVANADIVGTYVDATLSNTTPGSAITAVDDGQDTDNLWFVRARTEPTNWDVLVSNSPTEDSPALTTTVSGVANGSYNVYAVYWVGTNEEQDWNIQAGLAGGSLSVFGEDVGSATGFVVDDKQQRQALIGQVSVTNGSFAVTIDDGGRMTELVDYRSWYDGVSYEPVPEPSLFVLTLTGMLGLLAYAWRKRK